MSSDPGNQIFDGYGLSLGMCTLTKFYVRFIQATGKYTQENISQISVGNG